MTNTEKLLKEDGEALIIYPNGLGTVTMVRIKKDQWEPFQDFIEVIPDDQVIDIIHPATPDAIDAGVARLGRKERREGEYVGWDEKMQNYGLSPKQE
ncbi:MAG: hypothetical protein EBZ69_00385 [Alphaproteobacteria bacterium]|nr:hypothetical protein [Alphaproteobacteria bacterium]